MIEGMAQLHMTEAEVARDFAAVLEKIQQGSEVIVERDAQPVAVIQLPRFRGRPIDECIALAKARGSHATLDNDFAKDLENIIDSHREPLAPPSWDQSWIPA
jgi:antitoxin (DNA-binding transcriptional repressor) of toxin-antitoxin stability system